MNLDLDPPAIAFRDEVRAWLAANVPSAPLPSPDTPAGNIAHREWEARLAEAGLAAVSWPVAYGGRAAPPLHALLFDEEYFAAGAPVRIGQNGLFLLAPTLLAHGTADQCARILPPMGRGEQVWAQAWSEPSAGSDLAALRARARPADGGWLLSGQKTWSSRAVVADRAFGLFRSADEERHHGLTYLMFDLRAPGVTVRPIRQLDGTAGFAEIFLDDVFVPDEDVIGTPGDGWRIAMSTAGHERGLTLRGPGRFTAAAARLVAAFSSGAAPPPAFSPSTPSAASPPSTPSAAFSPSVGDRDGLGERVVDAWIAARAYRMQAYASLDEPVAPSATKLFWSTLDVALHETALDRLGPFAEIDSGWTDGYLFSLAGPIYAGTNEIQRDILAHRELGLPR
jgi:alkylation response protein AidB-like acyl-CoA dehydrogenase